MTLGGVVMWNWDFFMIVWGARMEEMQCSFHLGMHVKMHSQVDRKSVV